MPYPKFLWIVLLVLFGMPARAQDAALPDGLVVAWVAEDGMLAQVGQGAALPVPTAGLVVDIAVAPDGQHIALTSAEDLRLPLELWSVGVDGASLQRLVAQDGLAASADDPAYIANVVWLDATTILFSTVHQGSFGLQPQDDLWRADIDSGAVARLLPSGEGGQFSVSPDRQQVLVITAGAYGAADGRISLLDARTGGLSDLFTFPAVSTASEYRFYPQVFWDADSTAVHVAIPDKDLVYDDVNSPPVALWRLDIDGEPAQIGAVPASFFGLPQWSDDGAYLLYLQRLGAATSNQFALLVADGNGEDTTTMTTGEAGSFGTPTWIPGSTQFVYAQSEPGAHRLASPGASLRLLPEPMFNLKVVPGGIVYASAQAAPYELRYLHMDDLVSLPIATVNNLYPVFDGIVVGDG